MRDVLDDLIGWWQAGETVGMGTVVATWRSAPRPAGASMLVGPDGTAVGSVSGGCVEGAVYEEAKDAVESGRPVLQRYGVSDEDAFAVGLTCGGVLHLLGLPGLRHLPPLPRRARGRRRVAAPVPAGRGRRRPDRRAHGALRADPRPEVRRPPAGGRAAAAGGLRRRDGLAAHARGPTGPAGGGRAVQGGDRPAVVSDR